jgi:hypothetical protein
MQNPFMIARQPVSIRFSNAEGITVLSEDLATETHTTFAQAESALRQYALLHWNGKEPNYTCLKVGVTVDWGKDESGEEWTWKCDSFELHNNDSSQMTGWYTSVEHHLVRYILWTLGNRCMYCSKLEDKIAHTSQLIKWAKFLDVEIPFELEETGIQQISWYDGMDRCNQYAKDRPTKIYECPESMYWEQLECLPPVHQTGIGFGVGEAASHRADGTPTRAWFKTYKDRYFVMLGTHEESKAAFSLLYRGVF